MKLLTALLLVFLLCLSGCASATSYAPDTTDNVTPLTENDIDIAGIITSQAEVMGQVNTCCADMLLEINIVPESPDTAAVSIKAEMVSVIDIGNRLLNTKINSILRLPGQRTKLTQEIVATVDAVYLKDDTSEKWQARTMTEKDSENLWSEQGNQLTGSQYTSMMSPENFKYGGQAKVDGHKCLILNQLLDPADIISLTPELKEYLSDLGDLTPVSLEEAFTEINLAYYIDCETYHLREVYLTAGFKYKNDGGEISGTVIQDCRYDKFNEPVMVKVPEETG